MAAQLKDSDTSDRRLRGNDRQAGRCKQAGYLLLPVAVAIALIGVIAFLISSQSAIEVELTAGELDAARAEYVAQAGLQHALRHHAQQGCGPYTDLTNYPFDDDEYDTKLTTDLGSTTSYSIAVDQDTWIKSNQPDDNKGSDFVLNTRFAGGISERPLLRFDLSSVPSKATVLSATSWFYVSLAHPAGPVDVHRITADWTETGATWNTMNANMESAVITSIPPQPSAGVWVAANLTSQVQAWVNGEPNYGIMLNATVEGIISEYASRESANAPYLEVIVGTPPTSPAKLMSTSKIDGGGVASVKRAVTLVQQPGFKQLQPDAADGEDAEIWDQAPNNNYGAAAETWVSSAASDTTRSLLRFNMGAIPSAAKILQANLSLERQSGSGADQPVSAHRITNSWSEDSVTWNEREAGTNWDTAGGDYFNTAVATTPVGPVNQRYAWNITPLVQGWVDGSYPNHGVALVAAIAGMPGERFYTSDDADPSRWPSLSISYTCACGTACVAPQGSGKILMVVINPTTLVAEDQKAKDLFESWGYEVNVISESANQSSFDAGFAANDVVFISETVNASQVGGKTAIAPIGVVSQDGDYNDNLGLAPGAALKVGSSVNIVSTDHYITRPFSVGPLPIYARGMEQLVTSGALTADQQTLADIGGDASLVVLEKGDAMEGGGSAAGRRAILPLGTRYRFNWDYLNANGQLLLQRALQWGVGGGTKTNGAVLLVVPDATALGPQDVARQALIESWNYSVTPFTAASSQAEYDAAVAIHDVAYVSEETTSSDLNTKLRDAAIGVVNEETALTDEFGISSTRTGYTGTDVDVIDTSHYITSVFTSGVLTIANSATGLNRLGGTLAPGMDALAQSAGAPELAAIDTGGQLHDSGTAAGRRVQLPWGTNDFDINLLNDDGKTLMRRAIEWGAGIDLVVKSFKVLFVVGNVGGPGMTAEEIHHQTLIESWGHTVEIIDDGASQAEFDTAVANNDVVFITNDITASTLGTKLVNATIGVVTSEDNLSDEFGLASAIAWDSGSVIEINDNSHYITSPFSLGLLTILSTSESLAYVTGTLSPDLGQLASSTSGYGVVTLDTGEAMFGGGPVAGRRVQLPWGGNGFDPNHFNDDGRKILKRALEWGAGVGSSTGPIAHWKLDETTGFNAEDSAGDNDGTLTNGPDWTPGLFQGGLDFDGSNDYVDAGTFDVSGNGITMMGWFNAVAIASDDPRIVSKANGINAADAWWQLSTTDSGANRYLRMRIKAGGTTTTLADSSTNLSIGQWYFAVGTYDNVSGEMKLYLDGVEVASGAHAIGGALDMDPSVPVALGANGTAERFFDGILDDVRIYDYALSAGEIAGLAVSPGPIAHWRLDDATGSTAIDSVGGNDATLNGNPDWTTGTLDGALDFDGSGDYATTDSNFTPPPVGTVSFWMKVPGSPASHGRILGLDDTWEIRHVTTGTPDGIPYGLVFDLGVSGVNTEFVTTITVDTPDQWYFVAATYDTSNDSYAVYLDGLLHKSGTYPSALAVPADNPLSLGTRTGSTNYFDGTLDDVRIYNYVLGATAIADLFAAGGGGGGGPPTIFEVRVASGSDDAEERVSNGNVNNNSTDLELVTDGSNNQLVGMRFTNVTVPNGATISSAYIQFQVDETNSGATSVDIQGQAIDDAPTFTTGNNNISSRSRTSATVPWVPVPWATVGEAGTDQRTPNIATIIQEIIDQPGWVSGNDLVIIMTGSGERTAESYNGDSSGAALLHIEY